ncbi:hypothetical protein BCY86_02015 [Pajaroellobacter abortibovis]|uniref:Uncharacterized protein n=1 Tax=Pajaroellobacter abortibovis TaxID=1882918 RepID=A0A1L6MVM3_9BACT|nr:hypothetical protein BCY86_02015 [Pajaroellobacter abortibovis]
MQLFNLDKQTLFFLSIQFSIYQKNYIIYRTNRLYEEEHLYNVPDFLAQANDKALLFARSV